MIDIAALASCVATHGRVARVVIAGHHGSSPRETGAAMLVWSNGQSGTIGGGALEWEAATTARTMLDDSGARLLRRFPLGPALGQCCGGAVTVLTEVFDAKNLPRPETGLRMCSIDGTDMPLAVKRIQDRARAQGFIPAAQMIQGWFVEPVAVPRRDLWIWGAGHVGRALVTVLAPLPEVRITWVDVAEGRFPDTVPDGVTLLPCADAERLVEHAPRRAEHLILTYSHALDLELCHRLLGHGFARAGVIGSATKWARFRLRLASMGHRPEEISRITCPIGDPALGKHPQAIAIGVARVFLTQDAGAAAEEKTR